MKDNTVNKIRPIIFIGTSMEGLKQGEVLTRHLESDFEVLLWTQNVFQPSSSTLTDLLELRYKVDYAAFILTPDDIRRSRTKQTAVPRDNLIFELGLFMGSLGRERVFAIAPRAHRPVLPSDLLGINTVDYSEPDRLDWASAMGPVAIVLKQLLDKRRKATVDLKLVDAGQWTYDFASNSPIKKLFLNTSYSSQRDLLERIEAAKDRITVFGLTRNFFMNDSVKKLMALKAKKVRIKLFLMAPACISRKERYRIEPLDAALEDDARFRREILNPLLKFQSEVNRDKANKGGIDIFTYNFPCSFAIELIDDHCRAMLYGHNKRGTDGPILIFRNGTPYFDYFVSQLEWLESLASQPFEPWISRGVEVTRLRG